MRLQKVPRAFLDALDLKTDGRAPVSYADQLQGVFDMAAFYFLGEEETTAASGNVTANGDSISITVPQGQSWWMRSLSGTIQMPGAGGESMRGALSWNPLTNSAGNRYLTSVVWTDGVAQDSALVVGWVPPQPFIVPPGTSFRLISLRTHAAARAATLHAVYVPFG